MAETPLYLTDEGVSAFFRHKLDSGVSPGAAAKYRDPFNHLIKWLGDDRELTAQRLQQWRRFMEDGGFSKSTIQHYVNRVNHFLRTAGREDLCIPKPIRKELGNKTFGYLTAVEPTEKRRHGYVVWRCKCRCGKEVEVPSSMLTRGCTASCGCLNTEILRHANRYEEGTELRQALKEKVFNPDSLSGYVGVQPKGGKWTACITYKKKHYYLGTFTDLEDAVKARARAKEAVMEDAARIYEQTDYLYGEKPQKPKPPETIPRNQPEPGAVPARRSNNTSGCPGVAKQHGKWSVSISANKYRYRLGAYEDLEEAIALRKQAELLLKAGNLEALKAICTNWKK